MAYLSAEMQRPILNVRPGVKASAGGPRPSAVNVAGWLSSAARPHHRPAIPGWLAAIVAAWRIQQSAGESSAGVATQWQYKSAISMKWRQYQRNGVSAWRLRRLASLLSMFGIIG